MGSIKSEIINENPRIEIICTDCLEYMKQIPNKSIDLVLTDPPYKILFVGKGSLAKKFDYRKNQIEGIGSNPDFELYPFLEAIKSKLKIMNMYVWMAKGSIPETLDFIKKYNYFWDLLVWSKINPLPAYSHKYLSDLEYCFFIREKGNHWTKGLRYEDYKKTMTDSCQFIKGHPTPKPLWMMRKLITISSGGGQTVLDPFMGSGTTGVACKELGRNFIGIEIEPKYCEIAKRRISQATTDMFANLKG